ncbi:MAG: flagellar motor protein MotB [Clostridia bacterium]|nr:flagellar motor protein MotB [Clostridia bacterium]
MAIKKKAKPAEKENSERWLVSYSDFITLLCAVFIILYSMASADAKAAGSDGSGQASALAAIASAFGNTTLSGSVIEMYSGDSIIDGYSGDATLSNSAIEARNMDMIKQQVEDIAELEGLSDSLEVVIDDVGVHIRIKDAVLFNSGSPYINEESKPIMAKIGDVLKNLPNNYIQIEGHTDNIPMRGNPMIPSNWELGGLRAINVLKYLVNECALTPSYLTATSNGEFQPIATNDTAEGRAQNRRVEITILRNYAVE